MNAHCRFADHAAERRVICLGDVMVDVIARLPRPLLTGSDTPAPITLLGGGSAANTAAWLSSAGARVTLVGRTGDDAYGRSQRVQLIASGVDLALGLDPQLRTGTCIVLVDTEGERTMVPDAGANAALRPDDLPTELFSAHNHLHVSGYALFGGAHDAARAALRLARRTGMSVSVGAASAGPLEAAGPERFLDWIGPDAVLFANDYEIGVLSGAADAAEGTRRVGAVVGSAIVTRGASSSLWSDGGELIEVPVPPLDVLDSTGAGDAFAAGAIAAQLAGAGPASAVRRGHELAGQACRTVGARPVIGAASGSAPVM